MPRASPRKRATVNYNEDEKRPIAKLKKAPAKRMIKAEDEVEDEKKPIAKTKKAPAKRKVKEEDEDEDEGDEKAHAVAAPKVVKKRRTTTKKEDDATPLAERTDVPLLKKAMYIGAHVSAAGGKGLFLLLECKSACVLVWLYESVLVSCVFVCMTMLMA